MKPRERSLQFWLSEDLHHALRLKAVHERRTMKEIMVDLLTRHCARDAPQGIQGTQVQSTGAA